jgi:hypothetical protein
MPAEDEDLKLTMRLESILERLRRLELQVNRLMETQTVEGKEFLVKDERGQPRARFELAGHSPPDRFL